MASEISMREEQNQYNLGISCNVAVCRRILGDTLQIFTVDETFDAPFDHVDVWNEARGELAEDFAYEV
jgi:hypothetical protein